MNGKKNKTPRKKVRYAVMGLGYIAQSAVLPAFAHAGSNSELVALISDDPLKLRKLKRKYNVPYGLSYAQGDAFLESGEIDAIYIALPNSMHRDVTIQAAKAGLHVLCEKPMALRAEDCEAMISAARDNQVKLMVGYRLHFEKANMEAVKIAQSGKLGELRSFDSVFSMHVKEGDIRLQKKLGGGTLYDIGIYCINAARYLFRSEPWEVLALSANNGARRFREVDEMSSAILRFPGERLATFTTSFGAADVSFYRITGTRGELRLEPAYEYSDPMVLQWTLNGKKTQMAFRRRDQFAPELIYFSNCILEDKEPEPSGKEGMADVRIIEALYLSAKTGKPVQIHVDAPEKRPDLQQEIHRPPIKKTELVHAASPHAS